MESHHHLCDRFTEVSLSGNSVMAQGSHTLFALKHLSLLPVQYKRSWRALAQLGCFIRLAGLPIFSCQYALLFSPRTANKICPSARLNFQLVRPVFMDNPEQDFLLFPLRFPVQPAQCFKLCFCEGIGIGLVVIRDKNPAVTTLFCINRVIKSQCENIMVYRAYRNA